MLYCATALFRINLFIFKFIMDHETHTAAHHDTPVTHTRKKDDLGVPLAIVLAGALVAGAIFFTNGGTSAKAVGNQVVAAPEADVQKSGEVPLDLLALQPDDHVLGNPNAEVLIIEYSDTECPFCKKFHETMIEIINQYGKNGRVAWVYRHFPLDQIHPKSRKEGEALECANEQGGNEAFWRYTEKIFAITPANNGLDAAQLPLIASEIGLDAAKFNDCLASGKYAARIEKDFESGVSVGVKGTPFTIIWNKKTGKQVPINGAYPLANVKVMLESALKTPAAK